MIKKYSGVGALVVAIIAIFISLSVTGVIGPRGPQGPVGGAAGPTKTETQYFLNSFESGSVGASQASTTLAVSTTLQTFDWRTGIEYIEYTPTIGAVTLTTVASTTFSLGFERGSKREIVIYNATTTTGAVSVITFAAGTGIDLQEDEGETVLLNGLESARATFIRKADSDILMILELFQVGD